MNPHETTHRQIGPRRRGLTPGLEVLEGRALLATSTTFVAPDISDLARGAREGINTAPATIRRELTALQSQMTSGPLADLNAGTVDQAGFTTEVTSLLTSFDQQVDASLLPTYPTVDKIIKLNAARLPAELNSLAQQATLGVISSSSLATRVNSAITAGFYAGPIKPLGTPISGFVQRTQAFENDLNTLAQALSPTATSPLAIADVSTLTTAEGAAYQADMDAGLVGHPFVTNSVDSAVTTLDNQVAAIAAGTSTGTGTTQAQFQAAVSTFQTTLRKLLQAVVD